LHREVTPGGAGEGKSLEVGPDDLFAKSGTAADVRPEPGGAARGHSRERDSEDVAGVTHKARTGFGRHYKVSHAGNRQTSVGRILFFLKPWCDVIFG